MQVVTIPKDASEWDGCIQVKSDVPVYIVSINTGMIIQQVQRQVQLECELVSRKRVRAKRSRMDASKGK